MIPKISIITVSYNAIAGIEQTILSVINQTYQNVEYIIIDGGSTDGTVDVIRKYADKIVYWVSEPDKGIYDAMNKGIKKATGEWINFMNAGDCFYREDVISNVFGTNYPPEVFVVYGSVVTKSQNLVQKPFGLKDFCKCMAFCHQSAFVRKSKQIEFNTSYPIAADYNYFNSIYHNYGPEVFYNVEIPIAIYEDISGVSTTSKKELEWEYLSIRAAHKDLNWYIDKLKFIIKYTLLW